MKLILVFILLIIVSRGICGQSRNSAKRVDAVMLVTKTPTDLSRQPFSNCSGNELNDKVIIKHTDKWYFVDGNTPTGAMIYSLALKSRQEGFSVELRYTDDNNVCTDIKEIIYLERPH